VGCEIGVVYDEILEILEILPLEMLMVPYHVRLIIRCGTAWYCIYIAAAICHCFVILCMSTLNVLKKPQVEPEDRDAIP